MAIGIFPDPHHVAILVGLHGLRLISSNPQGINQSRDYPYTANFYSKFPRYGRLSH